MIFIKIISFLIKIGPLWAHKGPYGSIRALWAHMGPNRNKFPLNSDRDCKNKGEPSLKGRIHHRTPIFVSNLGLDCFQMFIV